MDEKDAPKLVDTELKRILQPRIEVPVPIELADEDASVLKGYLVLVRLVQQSGSDTVELPPRDERARLYGCDNRSVNAIEYRLHELGLIRISNMNQPGKKTRRRIILEIKLIQTYMSQAVGIDLDALTARLKELGVYITYTDGKADRVKQEQTSPHDFTPHVHALKLACKNRDKHGHTLASYDDALLRAVSGNAPEDEIATAIAEVESFKPANGQQIFSIKKAFESRFESGKLKPSRLGKLSEKMKRNAPHSPAPAVNLPSKQTTRYMLAAHDIGATIHPDEMHNEKCVDAYCTTLASGREVQRGDAPLSILRAWEKSPDLFVTNEVEFNRITLHRLARLVQLHPGYWRYTWNKKQEDEQCYQHVDVSSRRRRGSGPRELSAALQELPTTN